MATLMDLAQAQPRQGMSTLEKLGQTWPARAARSALSAMMLPGDVWAGRTQPGTDDYYDRAGDLAGLAMSGGTLGGVQGAGAVLGSGPVRRPYQNAPDSLMGFRRHGQQKGFDESNYRFELPVEITLPDGSKFTDAIKGLNAAHALERAYRNWDALEIKPMGKKPTDVAIGGNPIMGGAMATQSQDEDLGAILNRALTGSP